MPAFADAVENGLKDIDHVSVGLCGICPTCQRDHGMEPRAFYCAQTEGKVNDEGSFSWSPCDSCGSHLGGNRYAAHGWINDELWHGRVCEDCLFFIANGDEPETWEG